MDIQTKKIEIEKLFSEQKNILKNINISNFIESISKIRILEMQKEIIKAVPVPNYRKGGKESKAIIIDGNKNLDMPFPFIKAKDIISGKINPFIDNDIMNQPLPLKKIKSAN